MKKKHFVKILSLEPKKTLLNGYCILATFVDEKGCLHRYFFPFYRVHLRSDKFHIVDPFVIRGMLADDLYLNKEKADYILDLLKDSFEEKKPSFLKFFGL